MTKTRSKIQWNWAYGSIWRKCSNNTKSHHSNLEEKNPDYMTSNRQSCGSPMTLGDRKRQFIDLSMFLDDERI